MIILYLLKKSRREARYTKECKRMSPVKKQLTEIIDILPEQEQILLYEIAKRFVADDIATADDIAATNEARKEYANGETIDHNAINWD